MFHHVLARSEIYWRNSILLLQAYGNVCHKCETPMICIWFYRALFWFNFQLMMDSFDLFSYIILGCIAGFGKMNDCPRASEEHRSANWVHVSWDVLYCKCIDTSSQF